MGDVGALALGAALGIVAILVITSYSIHYTKLYDFVIVGSSNAVNLTDGLDGLAILPTVLIAGALGVFAYTTGNVKFAVYLGIPRITSYNVCYTKLLRNQAFTSPPTTSSSP